MIQFKNVVIHNFGSYGHVELSLQNKGYCLVSGKNNYKKDNALSNGSGKSFLWSAICFALTGETINGIKTNLKNINIDESDCYVQLEFLYNKDFFKIVRIISPKSDLKIFKNDIDVSGKGIRESEKKLNELLPELTKDLIASTIIIGQGMPNKFSSFSPSGRKELLEKLTKSDFMIEDLKHRIQDRSHELTTKIREFEDSLIANNTQLSLHNTSVTKIKATLAQQTRPDFDSMLTDLAAKITVSKKEIELTLIDIKSTEEELDSITQKLLSLSSEKSKVSTEEFTAFNESHQKLLNEKVKLDFTITDLQKEIKKLKDIKDICPTCGQKLPNIQKPNTEKQELELLEYQNKLEALVNDLGSCEQKHQEYIQQINSAFDTELSELTQTQTNLKQVLLSLKTKNSSQNTLLSDTETSFNKVTYDKQNWDKFIDNQKAELAVQETEIARLTNLINITTNAKEDLTNRLAIIKKMDSLIRRDFRGYLLTNIINYIDTRAKAYCEIVFGTKELSLHLNGNALEITYCGKIFDGLSGGEKQRVDLILQLAIRDMLISYLDLSANILVLDEITDFLDKKSCRAVMNLLEKELQNVESLFIISHHVEELELPIDSEIKIIKNENGISELY